MHASISDILADVAANSIEAGASCITVGIEEADGRLSLEVIDNGKGIPEVMLKKVFDPFYTEPGKHEKRKIGMGLPFVKQTCDACGGEVSLTSMVGVGTTIRATFDSANIDTPPLGDLVNTVLGLFNYPGRFELIFRHVKGKLSYEIARTDLAEAVGGFDTIAGLALAKDFLASQEENMI